MTEQTMIRCLALYVGEGGPISMEMMCADLDGACAYVRQFASHWYDRGENVLGLGAGESGDEVERALERDGWEIGAVCTEGYYGIYRRAERELAPA